MVAELAADLGVGVDRRLERGPDDDGVAAIGLLDQQLEQILNVVEPPRTDLEQRRRLGRLDPVGGDAFGEPPAGRAQDRQVKRPARLVGHDLADHTRHPRARASSLM